jgi:DNA-binding Lrp family transcriptional regulator
MNAYVLIKVRIGEIPDVIRALRVNKHVVKSDMTLGPYDVVALVEAEDLNELGNVVAFSVQCVPGVLETLTCMIADI